MILDEIVLHNVGPFRSRNVLTLTPVDSHRPVALIGGMNGNGKTTVLDSLHLALYGRQASFCRSSELPYDQQLRRLIHRRVRPEDGACAEVAFRSIENGTTHSFRVKRYWSAVRDRVKEHVDVEVDGARDPGLSDSWADEVQRFLPPALADLFFFDGERIEGFADPARSGILLASAIHSLLGVDLIHQLDADLDVLTRRRLRRTVQADLRPELESIAREMSVHQEQRAILLQEEAARRAEAGHAEARVRSLTGQLGSAAGDPAARRRELESVRSTLHAQAESTNQVLIDLAAGCLPLALILPRLESLLEEGAAEVSYRKHSEISAVLAERDDAIERRLESAGLSAKALMLVRSALEDDRRLRVPPVPTTEPIGVTESTVHDLEALLRRRIPEQLASAAAVLGRHSAQSESLDEVERRLAVAPSEQDAKAMNTRLEEARQRFVEADRQLQRAEIERLAVESNIQRLRDREVSLSKQQREADEATQDAARFAKYTTRGRELLARFRVRLVEQRVARLEQHILTGFRQLMRKDTLVHAVRIDAATCHMRLLTADEAEIHASRLSAGERQLLATAILWGLARASGRPVPVVIDTPLGRLDSRHRELLVDRYFPHASHQVVLLSTDEEIDQPLLARLRPHIGRTYRLAHEDRGGCTRIEEGYFW